MLDRAVIVHASPTLARLKLGSLFNIVRGENFDKELERLNAMFGPKGLVLTELRQKCGRALLYLYRPSELKNALECRCVQAFLIACGYERFDLESVLMHLRSRLENCEEFPHEIGVFLGYPLTDVIAFIENEGQNCLCCGCWKVYSNECEARRAFERFRKCKEVYGRLFAEGRTISQLTVRSRAA